MEIHFSESFDNGTYSYTHTSSYLTSTDLEAETLHQESSTASIVVGFLCAITIMGVLGNSAIIYLIASDRKLHRAPYYYLLCMSLVDLCKAVFCVPFSLVVVVNRFAWLHGDISCIILAFATNFFNFCFAVVMLTIAVERYISITFPRFYKTCSKGLICLAVIILGLGAAFCLSFPPVLKQDDYKFIESELQCTFFHKPYKENDTFGFLLVFLAMLCVTVFIYLRIFSFLRAHRRLCPLYHEPARSNNWTFFGPGANGQALINLLNGFTGGGMNPIAAAVQNMPQTYGRVVNLRVIRNEHLTRLFFAASLVYCALWLPYIFQTFLRIFGLLHVLSSNFVMVATVLSQSSIALCPLVYILYGSPVRTSIVKKVRDWRLRQLYAAVQRQSDVNMEGNIRCINLSV